MVKIIEATTPIIAIVAVVAVEIVAMHHGLDGTILAGALTIIGGLGGYEIKKVVDRLKK